MTIEIRMATLGMVQTNSFLVGDTDTRQAILIDPVDDAPALLALAEATGWTIGMVLATHAHFDHVLASKAVVEATDAPFYAHRDAVEWLERLPEQGERFGLGRFPQAAKPTHLIGNEDETITLDGIHLRTLYTPGHAPGHVAFLMPDQNIVFSGDALFQGSIGRTDLPGGDHDQLLHSIRTKLLTLDDGVRVLSGHGEMTTIGQERRTNPFLL